jgi:hypothetical protein
LDVDLKESTVITQILIENGRHPLFRECSAKMTGNRQSSAKVAKSKRFIYLVGFESLNSLLGLLFAEDDEGSTVFVVS